MSYTILRIQADKIHINEDKVVMVDVSYHALENCAMILGKPMIRYVVGNKLNNNQTEEEVYYVIDNTTIYRYIEQLKED